jgi:hypothetical protein
MPMNMNIKQKQVFHELRSRWLDEMLPLKKYTPTDLIEPLPISRFTT